MKKKKLKKRIKRLLRDLQVIKMNQVEIYLMVVWVATGVGKNKKK